MPAHRLSVEPKPHATSETFVIARTLPVFEMRAKTSGMVWRNQPVENNFTNNVSSEDI
jgi:hypothetical protein